PSRTSHSLLTHTHPTHISTLSLHDALPIFEAQAKVREQGAVLYSEKTGATYFNPWVGIRNKALASMHKFLIEFGLTPSSRTRLKDRKSTRLNSSHSQISYAVFCLKKKKK